MNKRSIAFLAVIFAIMTSRLVMSPEIQAIRAVDIATIFVAGLLAGVLLTKVVDHLRGGGSKAS